MKKSWSARRHIWKIGPFSQTGTVMERVVKLEAKSGREEVQTIEVAGLERPFVGLTAEEVGLTLVSR